MRSFISALERRSPWNRIQRRLHCESLLRIGCCSIHMLSETKTPLGHQIIKAALDGNTKVIPLHLVASKAASQSNENYLWTDFGHWSCLQNEILLMESQFSKGHWHAKESAYAFSFQARESLIARTANTFDPLAIPSGSDLSDLHRNRWSKSERQKSKLASQNVLLPFISENNRENWLFLIYQMLICSSPIIIIN